MASAVVGDVRRVFSPWAGPTFVASVGLAWVNGMVALAYTATIVGGLGLLLGS